MRSDSSRFCSSLSGVAEATFRIFPRSGRMAWVRRSRACLAEPPALSPSTMKISEPSAAWAEQSASLPGRRSLRVAEARATSLSRRRLRRSSARRRTKSRRALADFGWAASQ